MTAIVAAPTTWRVITPCVVVRGRLGTVSTFYLDDLFSTWATVDGPIDSPTDAETARLAEMNLIEAA